MISFFIWLFRLFTFQGLRREMRRTVYRYTGVL